jgi:hypothetical protein
VLDGPDAQISLLSFICEEVCNCGCQQCYELLFFNDVCLCVCVCVSACCCCYFVTKQTKAVVLQAEV